MSQGSQIPPPPVMWAQRRGVVYVTICLEDCHDRTVEVKEDKIYFKGVGGTDKKEHEVTINLYDTIDPDQTVKNEGRLFELILAKKNTGAGFWPRLTKESRKYHWLKSDFNKWKDEDETDDSETEGQPPGGMDKMMQDMLWNAPQKPAFDDLDEIGDDADSDDDAIPDLE